MLSHAQDDGDGNDNQGYIKNAIQHVHENPVRTISYLIRGLSQRIILQDQHQEQVGESDLSKYGPLIFKVLPHASCPDPRLLVD